jgi:hypothetical protein
VVFKNVCKIRTVSDSWHDTLIDQLSQAFEASGGLLTKKTQREGIEPIPGIKYPVRFTSQGTLRMPMTNMTNNEKVIEASIPNGTHLKSLLPIGFPESGDKYWRGVAGDVAMQ